MVAQTPNFAAVTEIRNQCKYTAEHVVKRKYTGRSSVSGGSPAETFTHCPPVIVPFGIGSADRRPVLNAS